MRIGIGSDISGFELKERLKARFSIQRHSVEDVSTSDLALRPHCALRCLPPAFVAIELGGSPNLVEANAI